jgi:arylsulfatase A-like enzyme
LTRRRLLQAAGIGIASAPAAGRVAFAATSRTRPNILWFRSEDNHYSYTGAYGKNRLAHTPNIDRLAREGVLFRNFYSTSPVCAPTKLAVLTGLAETSIGPGADMRAQAKLPPWMRGFATYLQAAGYWCTEADQLHNGNPDHNCALSMGQCGYEDTSGDFTKAPAGRPFFALAMTMTSHETFASPPVPGVTTGGFQPTAGTSLELPHPTDPAALKLPAYHPDTPIMRLDRAHYMDQIHRVDIEFGQLLRQLDYAGVADNTIVIYSADHGGVMPRSKRHCYDTGLHIPLIVRFPPRWQHLAPAKPGTTYEAPVSSLDLTPTILGLAGITAPKYMHGKAFAGIARATPRTYAFSNRNRMDEAIDFVRSVTDGRYRYTRNYMPHLPYGQHVFFQWTVVASTREWERVYRSGRCNEVQSRFWRPKPAEEFYDVRADPDEVHNLIDEAAYQNRIEQMRKAVDDHMIATNDNGFIPEGHRTEGWVASRRPGAYPLRQLMRLGQVCAQRDPRNLRMLASALHDDKDIVRYWGAMGLSMLDHHAAPSAAALAKRMRRDSSPWVRVQAADALTRIGESPTAVTYLGAVAADAKQPMSVRLQAICSLSRLGPGAIRALPQLIEACKPAPSLDDYVGQAARHAVEVVTGAYVPSP